MGARVFVECGAGRVLSQFVRRILANERDLEVHHPLVPGRRIIDGLHDVLAQCSATGFCSARLRRGVCAGPCRPGG